VNAKKTSYLYWQRLGGKERHERLSTGNRLIASEKVPGGEPGITLENNDVTFIRRDVEGA